MKQIVSVVTPWLGAGKTRLAVNLAACLALFEKKTLLVDGDPRGDASARLLPADNDRPGLYAFLTGDDGRKSVTDTGLDFLKIIPAGRNLFRAESELFSFPDRADLMKHKIKALAEDFEYVLIDSPSALGPLTVCLMAASEAVLIPLPCHADAPATLETLLPVVADVKRQWRPELTIAGIVFTQCDGWDEARAVFPDDLLTGIETVALTNVIPKIESSGGQAPHEPPAVLKNVMSELSERYLELAAELLER